MDLFGLLVVISLLVYVASLIVLLRATPTVIPGGAAARHTPFVSIIVPARDEERNVEACVRAALAQDYPDFEVVVVDDGSADATPSILARLASRSRRLRVVQGEGLPPAWTGKCFAVHQGAVHARGEWLLFLDADVVLEPDAVAAAVALARERGIHLLSVWPRQQLRTPAEQIVQAVVMAMYYFGELYHRLEWPPGLASGRANGQFLLAEAVAYRAVGGHEAVRGSVIEDHDLELAFRNAGFVAATANGALIARIRMYSGIGEVWQGWSKNTFAAMRHGVLESLGAAVIVGLLSIGPAVLAAAAIAESLHGAGWTSTSSLALASWSLLGVARWRLAALVPASWIYLPTVPLGGAVVLGILVNSALRYTTRSGVRWKGRTYEHRGPRGRSG